MKCWRCNTELVWGGDHCVDEDEDYALETNLKCLDCDLLVVVYTPRRKDGKDLD